MATLRRQRSDVILDEFAALPRHQSCPRSPTTRPMLTVSRRRYLVREHALPLKSVRTLLSSGALAIAIFGCSGADAPRPGIPTDPSPPQTRIDSFPVHVAHTDGIIATPPAGTYWKRRGESFSYAFLATPGYRTAAVRVGGEERTATGTLLVSDSVEVSAVSLPDTSFSARSVRDVEMERLAAASNPISALQQWESDYAKSDSAGRVDMDRAYFSALMRMGRDRWFDLKARIDRNQDARDLTMAQGVDGMSTQRRGAVSALTAAPGVAGGRLAVLFVNGILTDEFGSKAGRVALMHALASQNSPTNSPASARMVWFPAYNNPIASFDQSDAGRCVRELLFLGAAARGGMKGVAVGSLARIAELLRQRQHSECFSTNLRVITDYVVQVIGGTSSLNQTDKRLLDLIERERTRGGNVLIVAHSQGVVIARNVIAQLAADKPGQGCVALIAAGSPIQPEAPMGVVPWVRAVIARGTEAGVHDVLWPFWPGRTDGRSSKITEKRDVEWQALRAWIGLPVIGETIATLATLSVQLHLHYFVETYMSPDGYAGEIAGWARDAADDMDARCAWAELEVSPPAYLTAVEEKEDGARISVINRSPYRTRVRIVPSIEDAPKGRVEFANPVQEFELPPRPATMQVNVPFTARAGVAPGVYTLRYDMEAVPMVEGPSSFAVSGTLESSLRISVPAAHFVVTTEEAEVTIRATGGDPRPGTMLSLELDGSQRTDFTPSATGSSFNLKLQPGQNQVLLYTEKLPASQLLVGLEITVKGAVSGAVRRLNAGPLTTRSSANPMRVTIRRQFEVRP